MSPKKPNGTSTTPCEQCPLRARSHFRDFTSPELDFVSRFKTGELSVEPGAIVLMEGSHSAHLYTVLNGWGFRYKTLEDGRRQILNYLMPGDLVGLQGTVMGEMQHSVEALSPVTLCVFERGRLNSLFGDHPSLAYDLTWIAASEERMLDSHLLSVGRRTALERAAYLLAFLYDKASSVGLMEKDRLIPVTQQHVADTLGLSIVHTNKTLRKLADRDLIRWTDKGCLVLDDGGLAQIASWDRDNKQARPFI
ncbi:Crp/Fnr family transcriptional regulator [Agrobacterium sp. rho-13.3]|jgi:CRP-like cAMP-binding protein|uniref:Crp/Fnr family transcriptional regulator n=1 Tax=Agrobacterium sp. rho-13.3 TaxID=3072980 RepID=UPI002A0D6DF6|nr:Crp/Fnr family transcriptional regulator [Agrobacterium sp. rho-13.3]MDX8308882.1 Crp/Fnr family transcriptional regulator [Agrobacterium sp. rho-13.3]